MASVPNEAAERAMSRMPMMRFMLSDHAFKKASNLTCAFLPPRLLHIAFTGVDRKPCEQGAVLCEGCNMLCKCSVVVWLDQVARFSMLDDLACRAGGCANGGQSKAHTF